MRSLWISGVFFVGMVSIVNNSETFPPSSATSPYTAPSLLSLSSHCLLLQPSWTGYSRPTRSIDIAEETLPLGGWATLLLPAAI